MLGQAGWREAVSASGLLAACRQSLEVWGCVGLQEDPQPPRGPPPHHLAAMAEQLALWGSYFDK